MIRGSVLHGNACGENGKSRLGYRGDLVWPASSSSNLTYAGAYAGAPVQSATQFAPGVLYEVFKSILFAH